MIGTAHTDATGKPAASRLAIVAAGAVGTIFASLSVGALVWAVTQVSKIPGLEERVNSQTTTIERLRDGISQVRQELFEVSRSVSVRGGELAALQQRVVAVENISVSVERNIWSQVDREGAIRRETDRALQHELSQIKDQLLNTERRLTDAMLRRSANLPPSFGPCEVTPHGTTALTVGD